VDNFYQQQFASNSQESVTFPVQLGFFTSYLGTQIQMCSMNTHVHKTFWEKPLKVKRSTTMLNIAKQAWQCCFKIHGISKILINVQLKQPI